MGKKWYYSKTLWAALGTIVTSVGLLLTGEQTAMEWLVGALGVLFAYLRTITSEGLR